MTRGCKRVKGKALPKPPSGDRYDEGVGEGQGSKSLRLANISTPANVVQVKDNLNAAMVAAGDVEEKNAKESNKEFIAMDMTDVQNENLFSIDIQGVTIRFF
jgi:hypothetical protein